MIMLIVKLDNVIPKSGSSSIAPQRSFETTPPSSLFVFFGHPMYDVIEASTVNHSRSSRLRSNHLTDGFNVI